MNFDFNWYEVFVQALGFAAFAIFMIAYQIKDTRKTQLCFAPGNFLYGVQYILLGSLSGSLVMFAATARDVISVYSSKKTLKIVSAVYLVFVWGMTAILFKNWQEFLMPMSGTLSTIAVLYRDQFFKYRAFLLGRQVMSLLFNLWVGSQGGILHLLFTLGSNILGTYRHTRKTKEAPPV